MAAAGGSASGGSEDVARMQALLRDAGVTEYEPRVLSQLLDIAYSTTANLLTGARAISQHCGKVVIDETDVKIAVDFNGMLTDYSPDKMRLMQMAQEKNNQPLPQIRHNYGLKLPNDRFCLLQPNVEWRGGDAQQPMLAALPKQEAQLQPQVKSEYVVNMLKRKAGDDFDD